MNFSDIAQLTGGKILQQANTSSHIAQLIIDSRNTVTNNALFIAIRGTRHDGHQYISELYAKGVRNFIVESNNALDSFPEANILCADSAIEALQQIAAYHRSLFSLQIIGITGSNGKTIVKEWLASMLSTSTSVVKSPKSYNSQVGVPLSLWQISSEHEIGIFEAGISQVGEMASLERMIKPTFGIFTNIGSAHDEGFSDRQLKIREKLQLFKAVDRLIYCKDHEPIDQEVSSHNIDTFTWSMNKQADVTAKVKGNKLVVEFADISFEISPRSLDQAAIENLMHSVAAMLLLGYSPDEVIDASKMLPDVKMRLELKQGINGCQLVDDTYNNDLAGLEIALNFLAQQSNLPKVIILSDIQQSGIAISELYTKVTELLDKHNIAELIGIGSDIRILKKSFGKSAQFYDTTEQALDNLDRNSFDKKAILVKGARSFAFERITAQLVQKIHGTSLEINLNALTHNLNFYKSRLQPSTKLMVMVKALAYGSGSEEIARLLAHHNTDYFGVAYVDEGVQLRKGGIDTPIMVMNPSVDGFENILTHCLEPEIYNLNILQQLLSFLNGQSIAIHVKIDSGMRRLGFQKEDLNELVSLLQNHPEVEVKSIFTHLAGSDEAQHNDFSKHQVNTYLETYAIISDRLGIKPLKHVVNSPGIIRFPEYHFDMVRLGIGLYGIETTNTHPNQLLPISTLKTIISQINHIRAGETIGYGRRGRAIHDMEIATIAIGYADGFSRAFSNGIGEVVINGQTAPVIGNVCMDMTMVDITRIEAQIGDEVIVFGEQMPITKLADKLNTIPYEILTNVSSRVKRVYYLD